MTRNFQGLSAILVLAMSLAAAAGPAMADNKKAAMLEKQGNSVNKGKPITVTGSDPRGGIIVTIDKARVDLVLEHLRKHYGFEVEGLQLANQGEPLTATMSGSLQSILARLLRNWNHMIVRSPDNKTSIAKVMILNSEYGARASRSTRRAGNRDRIKKRANKKSHTPAYPEMGF